MLKRAAVVGLMGLAASLLSAPVSATASTPTTGYVAMIADIGAADPCCSAVSALWRTPDAALTLDGDTSDVRIGIPNQLGFAFLAPAGGALTAGTTYSGVNGSPDASHAGLGLPVSYTNCGSYTGSFTVHDIVADATSVTQLDVDYEAVCQNGTTAVAGQIHVGYPLDADGLVAPAVGRAPATYPGTTSRLNPTFIVNRGADALPVGTPVLGGTDAAAFTIVDDNCPSSLAAGAYCSIRTRFAPTAPGELSATLTVPTGATNSDVVTLVGTGIAGVTSWHQESDPGEYIGGGKTFTATPKTAAITPGEANPQKVTFYLNPPGYTATFVAADGAPLTVGTTYTNVQRYGNGNTSPTNAMSVTSNGGACNDDTGEFTVRELAMDRNVVEHAVISFVQYCDGLPAPLRGLIAYRAVTAAAPDAVAPGAISHLHVDGLDGTALLSWTNPGDVDYGHTVVRYAQGLTAPASPTSGYGVSNDDRSSDLVVLDPSVDFSFSFWPVDVSGNRGPRTTTIVRGTNLRLAAPRPINAGSATNLTGSLVVPSLGTKGPLNYTEVQLYARNRGTQVWKYLGYGRTGSSGTFAMGVNPTVTTEYLVRFIGDGLGRTGSSAMTVLRVAPRVGLRPSATSVRRGTTITMSVATNPLTTGTRVTLQKLVGGRWTSVASTTTSSRGSAAFSVRNTTVGTWTYRVVTAETTLHATATSAAASYRTT